MIKGEPVHVIPLDRDKTTFEYGVNILRTFPWDGVVTPPFGSCWAFLEPGQRTEANAHDEAEIFVVVRGRGTFRVADNEHDVTEGDIIYAPPMEEHTVQNTGDAEFLMMSIWWEPNGGTSAAS